MGISSRLGDVEMAVADGNGQLRQLGFIVDLQLPKLLSMAEEFRDAIEGLRKSMRAFSRGLISQLLGYQTESDVEAGPDT